MANASALTAAAGSSLAFLDGLDLSLRDDSSSAVIHLNAAFIAVVGLVVSLRVFVRVFMVRALGIDDGNGDAGELPKPWLTATQSSWSLQL